ncbi:MAG: nuclear transport factor 2 family protein [Proteobacteria bacterium]|nr:nuclear transport factor 2 family protein [Pseudomonadota bacterium]
MDIKRLILCAALALATPLLPAQEPPVGVKDQLALLKSSDPKLAANKKLVFDMYRTIIQAGRTETAEQFFTPGYIQHNPNVVSGRDALVKYIKQTRPARELKPLLDFPVISITAEGDIVVIAIVSWQDDEEGKRYANTHFDMFRIENGKIAEHWDHVAKSPAALKFDPNVQTKEKKPAK